MFDEVLRRCQVAAPAWGDLTTDDFDFDAPKGFSSITIGVRCRRPVEPQALLYRQLEGKENAILDFDTERRTFLLLGDAGIAARCLHYERDYRIEEFFDGRTLTAAEVLDPVRQRQVANELYRLHQLEPSGLPDRPFFDLLHEKWGRLARTVLDAIPDELPAAERDMCVDLQAIFSEETLAQVHRCLPAGPTVFCHNDTYHGNTFLLADGSLKLLDFEFSCRNHIAFDFANFFAETVMEHGLADPPHFRIGEPAFDEADLASLIGFYLDNANLDEAERTVRLTRLVAETRTAIMLSDYMYAMAALPLAQNPVQKIRFIPYAHQRFAKFLRSYEAAFGGGDEDMR